MMIVFTTLTGGRLEPDFPDTVCLLNPTEMEAGRALLTGLDVFSEQSLVLPRLEIRKLLELEGGRLGKR